MSTKPSISYPPNAVFLGFDPATHTTGACVLPIQDDAPVRFAALAGGTSKDEDTRLVQIIQGAALLTREMQRAGYLIVGIGVEKPSDRFAEDRHDISFMLGRAFDRIVTFGRRILHVPTYELLPADCSEAVGCARGAAKPARNQMSARISGVTDWDTKAGRGSYKGAPVGRDELDAFAAAFAGRSAHHAALIAKLAQPSPTAARGVARKA